MNIAFAWLDWLKLLVRLDLGFDGYRILFPRMVLVARLCWSVNLTLLATHSFVSVFYASSDFSSWASVAIFNGESGFTCWPLVNLTQLYLLRTFSSLHFVC